MDSGTTFGCQLHVHSLVKSSSSFDVELLLASKDSAIVDLELLAAPESVLGSAVAKSISTRPTNP